MSPPAKGERSLEVMAHPAFVDRIIVRKSAYCWPRLAELDVLTSASLKVRDCRARVSSGDVQGSLKKPGGGFGLTGPTKPIEM